MKILKKLRRLYMIILAIAGAAFAILFFCQYLYFVKETRNKEVASQLSEVYGQLNNQFYGLAEKNWNLLKSGMLAFYLSDDEEMIDAYIAQMNEQWRFNRWLFINENGDYVDTEGRQGYLNLGKDFSLLTKEKENIVVDGSIAGADPVLLFAAPVRPNTYKGFAFRAAALAYDKETMRQVLEDDSYEGNSKSYILYPDGRVLLSLQEDTKKIGNLFSILKEADFEGIDYEEVHSRIKGGQEGSCRYKREGREYYFYCQSVGFQDWILAGIVPKEAVGIYLEKILRQTIMVLALCFGLALAALWGILYYSSWRRIQKKEQELAYRKRMFEILSSNTSNMFVVLLPDTYEAEFVSSNAERLMGISPKDIQRDPKLLENAEYVDWGRLDWSRLSEIPLGGAVEVNSIRRHGKTGEQIWFEEQIYHVCIGDMERYIFVMQDRTREQESRKNLKTALDIAKTANESKSAFLSNMSHDIRTPMNVIIGFLPLLQRDAADPEKVLEYTRKISASSHHLLGLINDVLDMSKIESGKTHLNLMEFGLADMVEEIAALIRPQAEAKQQSFDIYVKDILHEDLIGDEMKLNQILVNILSNAVKYTDKGGRIQMTVQQLPQKLQNSVTIRFTVKDNGIGMSKEFLKHIFEPFSREKNGKDTSVRGTGLGMSIVKSLLDLMGGSISVESELGQGSVFTIDVGIRVQEKEGDRDFWKKRGLSRALVVDDDLDVCMQVVQSVRADGLDMDYALGGQEALDKLLAADEEERSFDLVLLDWKMPGMDGLQTARQIFQAFPDQRPILILTSYDWSDIGDQAEKAGVSGFLLKPFFLSNFKEVILQIYAQREEGKSGLSSLDILKGAHFLVAEDYELNAEILAGILEMYGVTCDICVNGLETLKKLESSKEGFYDLILMDIQMPVMDGCKAACEIRGCGHPQAASIPIVAMSANAFSEDVQKAMEAGMDAYLTKPVDKMLLEKTLTEILEKRRQESQEKN